MFDERDAVELIEGNAELADEIVVAELLDARMSLAAGLFVTPAAGLQQRGHQSRATFPGLATRLSI